MERAPGHTGHLAAWKILFLIFSFDRTDISFDEDSKRLLVDVTAIGDISTDAETKKIWRQLQ